MNVDEMIAYLFARGRYFMESGNLRRGQEYMEVAQSFKAFFEEKESRLNGN